MPAMMHAGLPLPSVAIMASGARPALNTWLCTRIAPCPVAPSPQPSWITSFRTVATSACSGTAPTGNRFVRLATTQSSSGRSATDEARYDP